MKSTQLIQKTSDLNDQLTFLIRREFYVTYGKYRKSLFTFLGLTMLVIALAIFTKAESFITLKAVSMAVMAIAWAITLVVLATILIKLFKRNVWKRKRIREALSNNTKFEFGFDEEELHFVTNNYSTDIKWDYYKYYAINKNSIFIIPPNNIYEAICFSKNELGIENFESLKIIASTKLIMLDEKKRT